MSVSEHNALCFGIFRTSPFFTCTQKQRIGEGMIERDSLSSNNSFANENINVAFILPEDKNNIFLLKKIISKLEYLFSYNDIVEEKI
jgi:hypothetical protein